MMLYIVHYNDQLYLVNPPPHPQQPVLFVNDGGQINGVFVKGKSSDNAENVIYELDNSLSKKPSDNKGDKMTDSLSKKPSDNKVDEVTYSFSGASDVHYKPQKGFLSADKDKILPILSRVIKKDGCKMDSELERFDVMKYKMEEVTKPDNADDAVVKSDTKRDVMKRDVVTEEEMDTNMPDAVNKDNAENGAVTQPDDAVVMKNDEMDKKKPDGVTKLNYHTETKSHSTERKFDFKSFHSNVCDHAFWTEGGL